MCASFLHCLKTLCGNHNRHSFAEFGNEKRLLLKVDMAATLAGGVELGCADTVRIPAPDEGGLTGDIAYASHKRSHAIMRQAKMQKPKWKMTKQNLKSNLSHGSWR